MSGTLEIAFDPRESTLERTAKASGCRLGAEAEAKQFWVRIYWLETRMENMSLAAPVALVRGASMHRCSLLFPSSFP
jgi:hypothetical protein